MECISGDHAVAATPGFFKSDDSEIRGAFCAFCLTTEASWLTIRVGALVMSASGGTFVLGSKPRNEQNNQ